MDVLRIPRTRDLAGFRPAELHRQRIVASGELQGEVVPGLRRSLADLNTDARTVNPDRRRRRRGAAP